ncbi:MAG: DUF1223 domain-containing protein [Ignavibacteriota bacterium]
MLRSPAIGALVLALAAAAAGPERAPVLVELFTSEGCSSCPPADAALAQLDRQAIVLSEHVDYWDQLGWKDRFSSEAFTQRQQAYAKGFGIDSPYTPQMVVDGQAQFVGSDTRRAAQEIAKAAARSKASIVLVRSGAGVKVTVEGAPREADIWLALADNSASTEVRNGENRGHTLRHVAVVRSMRKIGSVKRGGTFGKQVDLPGSATGQRVVVFLQEAGQAHVLGAAMLPSAEN